MYQSSQTLIFSARLLRLQWKFDMLALLVPPTTLAFRATPVRLWLRFPLHTVCRRLWSRSREGKICKNSIPHPVDALYWASMFTFCVLHLGMSNWMNAGFKLGHWLHIGLDDIGENLLVSSEFIEFFWNFLILFRLLMICNFSDFFSPKTLIFLQ